jgi:hypothetical protein
MYKSPGIDQIPAELIKAGGSKICSEIHKLVNSILNKEELPDQWKESIIVPLYKKGDKTDCSNYRGISLLSTTYKILSNILLSKLTHIQRKLLGIISVGFDITGQLLIRYSAFVKHSKKWEYNEAEHQLFVDFKKVYDSVRREVLYNILIDFGILLKLVRLIKIYLNEIYGRDQVGKHLCDRIPIKSGLKQGDAISPLLSKFALEYAIRRIKGKPGGLEIKWNTSTFSLY